MVELTVLMPCLNEEESLSKAILDAKRLIKKLNVKSEILIIDNMSEDNSVSIAKSHGCRVLCQRKKGYGNAIRYGFTKAKGKYIILADCDGSYRFSEAEDFYKYLTQGYMAVFGNRYKGRNIRGSWSFSHKYIGVPILSFIGRKRYKCKITDFHCGLMGFNSDFVKLLNLKSKGFEFASEIIGKTCNITNNYIEIPVTLHRDNRIKSKSHIKSVKDGLRHVIMIIFDISI